MKKSTRIISAILSAVLVLSVLAALSVSAATTPLVDNKEAQKITATAEGIDVALTWNLGYIGTKTTPASNIKAFELTSAGTNGLYYSDVICVEKAGTEIVWIDSVGSFFTNSGYILSTWEKNAEGNWVADPLGANYFGMAGYGSPVETKDANGVVTYKYVTYKDNECLRLGYYTNAGDQTAQPPTVNFKLTGEKGTFVSDCEKDESPVTFNPDGTVTGVHWWPGYVGSATNTNGFPNAINYFVKQYAYTSVITIPKAGTTISFTDSASVNADPTANNVFASNAAWVVSHWTKAEGELKYQLVENGPNCAGNSGNGVAGANFTEVKNADGSVTYTYTTTSDNEQIRFCYRNDTNHNSLPGVLPVITYVVPASDPEATTPAETTTATPAETTTATVGDNTTAPADDTTLPENTTVEAPVDETTATVEETTATVTSAENKKEKGCGGFAVATQIIALFGTALTAVVLKKKA